MTVAVTKKTDKRSIRLLAILAVLVVPGWSVSSWGAQKIKDADCLTCHGDTTLTTEENGKQVSLFVDQNKLKHSFHSRLFGCVDCHTDVKSLAHDAPPKKITCAGCHEAAERDYLRSMHARTPKPGAAAGATCVDCHGGAHETLTPGNPASPVNHANIPTTCGRCHGQRFITSSNGDSAQTFLSYQESVHGRAVREGLAEGRRLHRLPWRARHPRGQRAAIAYLQVQCAGHLRQVPRRHPADLHGQHSWAGNYARQRPGPGVH